MGSQLVITPVENLQEKVNNIVKSFKDIPGIYISLNKTQESIEKIFKRKRIKTDRLFFIDCVTSEKTRDDVLHISPFQLDLITSAINAFVRDVKGKKFIVIDALSPLLIYNTEDKVAEFIKDIKDCISKANVKFIVLSPKTRGKELLERVFAFFDRVEQDEHICPREILEWINEMRRDFPTDEGHVLCETWADDVQAWKKKWLGERE